MLIFMASFLNNKTCISSSLFKGQNITAHVYQNQSSKRGDFNGMEYRVYVGSSSSLRSIISIDMF